MDKARAIERSIITKYRKTIWNKFIEGVKQYKLVNEGDKIAVCLSGGKDSALLAKLMQELQKHGEADFELKFIVMDPGYSKVNRKQIEDNAEILDIPIDIFETDIFASVEHVEKSPCYLCARMRRGNLYSYAKQLGCNKIALGHHFDDAVETVLLGLLFGGQVQTMLPKLHSTNFEGMELIRPMYCVHEEQIIKWGKYNNLEFLRCACRFTEQSEYDEGQSKRLVVKNMLKELHTKNEQVEHNIFRSVENVNLNTVIGYTDKQGYHTFLDEYDSE